MKKRTWQLIILSVGTGSLIALFWAIYYLFAGEVPTATSIKITERWIYTLPFGISRWWDILIGPIWSTIIILILTNKRLEEDDKNLVIALATALVFTLVFIVTFGLALGLGFGPTLGLGFGLGFRSGFVAFVVIAGLVFVAGLALAFTLGFVTVTALVIALVFGLGAGLGALLKLLVSSFLD